MVRLPPAPKVSSDTPVGAVVFCSCAAVRPAGQLVAEPAATHVGGAVHCRPVATGSNSREPSGLAAVLDAARNDKTPQIRSKALFWLAQKAAAKDAQQVIGKVLADDPDRGVKEQAVFALKNLPGDQGIPMLIEVAKSNPDAAVRKKAMFWLGQSKDAKALDFFASVLKQ